ncbi:hypothetical protein R3P38DRAFT_2800330 [Favolaschia claudopus]|uniref:Uncharacterized protein n=1 Tax=Favolaschia claudopus TaxID=2862362 RepID=A0AAV9ZXK2_9AGAR
MKAATSESRHDSNEGMTVSASEGEEDGGEWEGQEKVVNALLHRCAICVKQYCGRRFDCLGKGNPGHDETTAMIKITAHPLQHTNSCTEAAVRFFRQWHIMLMAARARVVKSEGHDGESGGQRQRGRQAVRPRVDEGHRWFEVYRYNKQESKTVGEAQSKDTRQSGGGELVYEVKT